MNPFQQQPRGDIPVAKSRFGGMVQGRLRHGDLRELLFRERSGGAMAGGLIWKPRGALESLRESWASPYLSVPFQDSLILGEVVQSVGEVDGEHLPSGHGIHEPHGVASWTPVSHEERNMHRPV